MVTVIMKKEFRETLRYGRFRWTAGIVFVLLVASLMAGWRHAAGMREQVRAASNTERLLWLTKGNMNPHSAAHYGAYVFKPQMLLSAIDQGVDPYTGTSVYLEAHKINQFQFKPAQDSTPIRRFGELTAAMVMQILIPLLIVMLTFATFSGEREQGTLRQLLSMGVRKSDLAKGKALGVALTLLILTVPAVAVGAVAMILLSQSPASWAFLPRVFLIILVYLLYYGIFLAISLMVSARLKSSRAALVTLLSFWFFASFLVPRLVSDLARKAYPVPTALEFVAGLEAEKAKALPWGVMTAQVKQRLLKEYRVDSIDKLPVNPEGVALIEGEENDTRIHDKHFSQLFDRFEKQTLILQAGSVASPLLAVQSLSMGLCGTDFVQHRRFNDSAEEYRRQLVWLMNDDLKGRPVDQTWSYKADRNLWEKLPPFDYTAPGAGWILSQNRISLILLLAWFGMAVAAAPAVIQRMRID